MGSFYPPGLLSTLLLYHFLGNGEAKKNMSVLIQQCPEKRYRCFWKSSQSANSHWEILQFLQGGKRAGGFRKYRLKPLEYFSVF